MIRKCIVCKIEKEANEENFYKDKNRPLGLMYRCKECDKKRIDKRVWKERIFTEEQKNSKKIANKKYAKTNKGKSIFIFKAYKNHDKKHNRVTDLKSQDILDILHTPCTYCGFPSTGFDRIDNSLGHMKENVVPCCKECNVARMDNFSHKEMFILGKTIREIKLLRK